MRGSLGMARQNRRRSNDRWSAIESENPMTDRTATSNQKVVREFLYGGNPELFADDAKLINLLPEELQPASRIESLEIDEMITSSDRVVVVGSERSRFYFNG